eukprot:TRINITY_DN22896_c0_g1_i1.p2 TRINITY_DN22896_c0_g1~~TRINITY_DN22896_c0_g1_i1.p2  ORF type:complete len:162 (-),score=40.86 TRINITY_DN22896_c0_g1_i1:900-1385(-)
MATAKRGQLRRGESQAALNDEQVEEFKSAFDMFDEAQQGFLTKSDVQSVFNKYGVRIDSKQMDELWKEGDPHGSGQITFPQFVSMMARKMKQTDSQADLLEAFRVFDPYGDNFIDEKEISEALLHTGDKLNKDELHEMLSICAIDGRVDYSTFVKEIYANK